MSSVAAKAVKPPTTPEIVLTVSADGVILPSKTRKSPKVTTSPVNKPPAAKTTKARSPKASAASGAAAATRPQARANPRPRRLPEPSSPRRSSPTLRPWEIPCSMVRQATPSTKSRTARTAPGKPREPRPWPASRSVPRGSTPRIQSGSICRRSDGSVCCGRMKRSNWPARSRTCWNSRKRRRNTRPTRAITRIQRSGQPCSTCP